VQEADTLVEEDKTFVEQQYADIVRALKHASTSPEIDESSAVSRLLLSVAAPALNMLETGTSDSELNAIARQILRERASLFNLSNVSAANEPTLQIELDSSILDVQGFPIDFPKSHNPIQEVRLKLGRKSGG
jgi:hypothetical protein